MKFKPSQSGITERYLRLNGIPINPYVKKSGRAKMLPIMARFIYEHPRCSWDEIRAETTKNGYTGYGLEMMKTLRACGFVITDGRPMRFSATKYCKEYLDFVGFPYSEPVPDLGEFEAIF